MAFRFAFIRIHRDGFGRWRRALNCTFSMIFGAYYNRAHGDCHKVAGAGKLLECIHKSKFDCNQRHSNNVIVNCTVPFFPPISISFCWLIFGCSNVHLLFKYELQFNGISRRVAEGDFYSDAYELEYGCQWLTVHSLVIPLNLCWQRTAIKTENW